MPSQRIPGLPQHIHLVGIGGIGLSAIARVLVARGYRVSGSDLRATPLTAELNRLGVRTFVGHAAEQIRGAELIVVSSAVPEANPEIVAARQADVPVWRRRRLLAEMLAGHCGIAVAGTHGKTTTAAMIAVALEKLGLDPTFIVGGVIANLGTNARSGQGPHFVLEADEYDHTFEDLAPAVAVVTNIEMDHPDCYADVDSVRQAFEAFLGNVPATGHIVACADSPQVVRLLAEKVLAGTIVTYGQSPTADYVLEAIAPNARGGTDCRVATQQGLWAELSLGIPGRHNALNATAALLALARLGVDPAEAAATLAQFRGALRRFEIKGEAGGVLVVDDYAHHPTEIRATLAAARARYPERRIWVMFQPHTFSRVQALLDEFAACFTDVDHVIVTDVYAARASEHATIHASELARLIRHPEVRYIGALEDVVADLLANLRAGDLLLTCGAGDGYLVGERVLAALMR